ncbi:NUDIX domain-containing protein [Roseateles sp.]|uniref:NUDIX hydrolase n=1 Tax=Roseateles sp. TaxID=1971397 RepID=UPI0025F6302E|nr:NUDIX domain-containing protein [Roseateles sp.]MBV8037150.1 NUDIX domain-containing protein [Roseateles sp.]
MNAAPHADPIAEARHQLGNYLRIYTAEASGLQGLVDQLADDADNIFDRGNMRGHITTSALVYDDRADAILMIHHKGLARWLQPGGHHEGLQALAVSAAREVAEETGVVDLSPWPCAPGCEAPLDIDTHPIPRNPRKHEGEHVHHDFIYLYRLSAPVQVRPQWSEVDDVRWMPRDEFGRLPEHRFARLWHKLDARLSGQLRA